jgi:plastocyanin
MMINTRRIAGISVFAAALGLVAFASARASTDGSQKMGSAYQVKIQDFSFQPVTLNVPVGATVTWTNEDEEPHTVFSNDSVFKSKALDTDNKFSFTFKKIGTYKYFCSVHPKMVGTVIVGSAMKKSEPMKTDQMKDMN